MFPLAAARRPPRAFLAAALILAGGAALRAQTGAWFVAGPPGGNVRCIVSDPSDPSVLYVGTDEGVSRSEDGGATWAPAGSGLPAERVQTIAIDPADPQTLYAGTLTPDGVPSVGIFRSRDGGASWTAINAGLVDPLTFIAPLDVAAIAADPSHPGTLLAGTRFSEIFKSTDGGDTWEAATLGGFDLGLETSAIVYDPTDSAIVYAATTQGLLKSVDGGDSWNVFGDANVTLVTLAIDPSNPQTLYAGNATGFGVGQSTDGGATWNSINGNLPATGSGAPLILALALAVDPAHSSVLYAGTYGNGLFQTSDGGTTWSPVETGLRSAYVTTLLLGNGGGSAWLAGTLGGGIYRSADGGATWTPSSQGLDFSSISALQPDPGAPGRLYAAAFDGVYASDDVARSWQAIPNGLPVAPVAALGFASGAAAPLLAGTLGGGILASADGGAQWTSSSPGLSDPYVGAIAVDPATPSTVYAGTSHPADSSSPQRVFQSVDGGATWTQTSLDGGAPGIGVLAVNPADPATIVAASPGATTYFRSSDSGATWSTVTPDASCGDVFAAVFDVAGTLTIAGSSGICRSADGGATWTAHAVAASSVVQALLVDPDDASILYAGATPSVPGGPGGVFRSGDGGATWQPVGTGIEGASVTSLFEDRATQTLFAGIDGGGVAAISIAPPVAREPVLPPPSPRGTRPLPPR